MLIRTYTNAVVDWASALLLGVLLVSPGLAGGEAQEIRTAETQILKALDETTAIEFIDEPLSGVAAYLRELHGIEIQVDMRALEDVNQGSDIPITKRLDGISLRSALNLMLRDLDLTWTINNEALVITTPEEAELLLVTRVYDVGDLVTVQDPEGNRWQDFEPLSHAIRTTVKPDTWEDVGGPGSLAELEYRGAKVLAIRQTCVVHEEIDEFLRVLQEIAGKYDKDVIPTRKKPKPQLPQQGFPGAAGGGGMGGGGGGGLGGGMEASMESEPE